MQHCDYLESYKLDSWDANKFHIANDVADSSTCDDEIIIFIKDSIKAERFIHIFMYIQTIICNIWPELSHLSCKWTLEWAQEAYEASAELHRSKRR